MKRKTWVLAGILTTAAIALTGSLRASSHREAPLISRDPLADNTDVYAFVSPAQPDRVMLIANFIPFEEGYGGPNFFKFDDNVLYEIMVDNDGGCRRGRDISVPVPHVHRKPQHVPVQHRPDHIAGFDVIQRQTVL